MSAGPGTLVFGILSVGALASGALVFDGTKALTKPKPKGMMIASLDAHGGLVRQSHVVFGGNQPATWAARIEKDGEVCEGSSGDVQASYQSSYEAPNSFTSIEWTGDASCEIAPEDADTLWAQWQYVTQDGLTVTITAER